MTQAFPFAWHMLFASHVATLMESLVLTGIAVQVSEQTRATESHMHAESPWQVACVVYVREQCWAH